MAHLPLGGTLLVGHRSETNAERASTIVSDGRCSLLSPRQLTTYVSGDVPSTRVGAFCKLHRIALLVRCYLLTATHVGAVVTFGPVPSVAPKPCPLLSADVVPAPSSKFQSKKLPASFKRLGGAVNDAV